MRKSVLGLVVLLGIGITSTANAHNSFGFSLDLGGPSYYGPPPVYYTPPPIVYYRIAPVYREYDGSINNYYYLPQEDHYYDEHREHDHQHHEHEHHEDDED